MLIKVDNIKKEYQNEEVVTRVLKGISFSIDKGEFVSIMGPSGSGKSTLMHIMGLLDRPSTGKVYLKSKEISTLPDDELARLRNEEIGFVFQSFNLLARTSVLDNVRLPLGYSGDTEKGAIEKAKKAIEDVELTHRIDHAPNQLSGGEKQRVAIARALVNNPAIVFADEPTGNLDSKSGAQIMKLLGNLSKKGNTIILVTHELDTAKHAERIIKLKDGEILSDEKVKERRKADGELNK